MDAQAANNNFCRFKALYVAKGNQRLAYTKMLGAVTKYLQKHGVYMVFTMLNNGLNTLEFCETAHYDVIFVDDNVDGISPVELAFTLRQLKYVMPIIRITSSSDPQSEQQMDFLDAVLVKPFGYVEMVKVILQAAHVFPKALPAIKEDDPEDQNPKAASSQLNSDSDSPWTSSCTSSESEFSGDSSYRSISPKTMDDMDFDLGKDFDSFFDGELSDAAFL